jgi:CheY-like chemotaxis protein
VERSNVQPNIFAEAFMPNGKSKLLIVDDEPETRLLLSQIFAGMGHEVECAEDGFSALEQIRQTVPDIILSDLNMPGMSGFELLSVVRRRLPAIYVIATSGAYTGRGIPRGIVADAFYQKATGLDTLFQIMQAAVKSEPLATRSPVPAAPIWISMDSKHYAGPACVIIACPECMRAFPHAHDGNPGLIQQVRCSDCGAAISYAIVEVLDAVSERAYQAELDSEMSKGWRRAPASEATSATRSLSA